MRERGFEYIRTAKAQIRLRICAFWSGHFLSTNGIIGYYRMYEWWAKARMILCACTVWSESAHFVRVRLPFSVDAAQMKGRLFQRFLYYHTVRKTSFALISFLTTVIGLQTQGHYQQQQKTIFFNVQKHRPRPFCISANNNQVFHWLHAQYSHPIKCRAMTLMPIRLFKDHIGEEKKRFLSCGQSQNRNS